MAPLVNLFALATQAATYKASYDELLWRDRHAQFGAGQVHLVAVDKRVEEALEMGKVTLGETYGAALAEWRAIERQPATLAGWQFTLRQRRRPWHLHLPVVVGPATGYVQPLTRPGWPPTHLADAYARHKLLATYYAFAWELPLPVAADLTVEDVSTLYAVVRELAGALENQAEPDSDTPPAAPVFRIREENLLALLRTTTDYDPLQLTAFVDLLTHQKGERINFWHKPFVRRQGDLLFALLPLAASQPLYLVDKWLLAGGYPLAARGKLFEHYLRRQLPEAAQARGFFCRDLSGELRVAGQARQVDVLLEFQHCLLLVEAKCLGYPLEARDKHNAYQYVREGAEQVRLTAAFLQTHRTLLANHRPGLATKPLVQAVITSLPLFSGLVVAGVPVTDAASLLHYLKAGGCWRGLSEVDEQGRWHRARSEWVSYYDDEQGFCQHLPQYLIQPVFVTTMQPFCHWHLARPGANLLADYVTVEYPVNSPPRKEQFEPTAMD